MATIRQKRLAKNIAEALLGKEVPEKKKLMVSAGYSEITAGYPKRIVEGKGVQKELEETYGFTEENAKKVVSSILLSTKSSDVNKLRASEQIFKVKGSYAPEKSIQIQARVPFDPVLDEIRKEYEEKLRASLIE